MAKHSPKPRLEDATLDAIMARLAAENRGSVFQTPCWYGSQYPAHPSLALSMYGVIEEGTEKVLKGRNNTGGGAAPVINITPIHKPCMGEIIS